MYYTLILHAHDPKLSRLDLISITCCLPLCGSRFCEKRFEIVRCTLMAGNRNLQTHSHQHRVGLKPLLFHVILRIFGLFVHCLATFVFDVDSFFLKSFLACTLINTAFTTYPDIKSTILYLPISALLNESRVYISGGEQ